jgi:hypothetical protein
MRWFTNPESEMSSQFLQTEIANLIQESRRKNTDLRNVRFSPLGRYPWIIELTMVHDRPLNSRWMSSKLCHQHLRLRLQQVGILQMLFSLYTANYLLDLVRKPKFVEPFIIACHTKHAKLAGIGVICLQRLIASRSLPSSRLKDVLGGLRETTSLSTWPDINQYTLKQC